uniref:Uncharacterized protein n=1 Tax=Branchiostoma floridae TaxID=7739 RepID=C3YUU5_BRAFL|eukprot:XP_002599984.1 hypothetical protein BRAFLDRAFT_74102 [Branchiostoma floridae]
MTHAQLKAVPLGVCKPKLLLFVSFWAKDSVIHRTKYDWEPVTGCFTSASVGRAGVWTVDSDGHVYHRAGTFLNETSPGEEWVHIPAPTLQRVAVGDGIIWGLDSNNRVFANVLPTPVGRDVCQVGLAGQSRCYAVQNGNRISPEEQKSHDGTGNGNGSADVEDFLPGFYGLLSVVKKI